MKGKFSNQHSITIALTIHFQNIMCLPSQQYDTYITFMFLFFKTLKFNQLFQANFSLQAKIGSQILYNKKSLALGCSNTIKKYQIKNSLSQLANSLTIFFFKMYKIRILIASDFGRNFYKQLKSSIIENLNCFSIGSL